MIYSFCISQKCSKCSGTSSSYHSRQLVAGHVALEPRWPWQQGQGCRVPWPNCLADPLWQNLVMLEATTGTVLLGQWCALNMCGPDTASFALFQVGIEHGFTAQRAHAGARQHTSPTVCLLGLEQDCCNFSPSEGKGQKSVVCLQLPQFGLQVENRNGQIRTN